MVSENVRGLDMLGTGPDLHTPSRHHGRSETFFNPSLVPTPPRSLPHPALSHPLNQSTSTSKMVDATRTVSYANSDEKLPITPTEPSSPPKVYDPSALERGGQPSPGEPITAVNSITLDERLMSKEEEGRPFTPPAPEPEEPDIPLAELPLVVRPFSAKMRKYLMNEVDTNIASFPLAAYCFMTGYVGPASPPLASFTNMPLEKSNAITYTACYVWSAFQTGNTIQCGMAIAKLFTKYPHPVTESPWPTTIPEQVSWNPLAAAQWDWRREGGIRTSDAQALASLLCFLFGAFCGRFGDHIGARKRAWLISNTFLQALFTLGATLCCHANGESSFAGARGSEFANWGTVLGFCTLGFTSAAMGLQAHAGVRIGNIFNSTVVLTTIWVQLVSEPKLFKPSMVKQRDHKVIAIAGLVVGGLAGRALINTIGTTWTLAIGAIVRVCIGLSWLSIPAAKSKK